MLRACMAYVLSTKWIMTKKKKKWVKRRRKRDSIAVDSHSYFLSSLQVTLFSLPTSFLYTCAARIRIVGFRPFGDAPLIVRYPERMASLTLGLIFSLSLPRLSLSLSLHTQICLFAVWLLYRAIDCPPPPPITAAILNMTILSVHRTQNMNRNSKSPPSTTFQ